MAEIVHRPRAIEPNPELAEATCKGEPTRLPFAFPLEARHLEARHLEARHLEARHPRPVADPWSAERSARCRAVAFRAVAHNLPSMKILFWHGYLLTGTGSNIYTSNVCRTFRKEGHDVFLMCQHKRSPYPPFLDDEGDFEEGNRGYKTEPTGAEPALGRCRLIRPNIAGLLPVYVYEKYPHIEAKAFVDLTTEELEIYVETNVQAMVTAIEDHRPDAIFVGHEVMGPYLAKLACEKTGSKYAVQLHGSALEYAVKKQDRYLRYATEGLGAAHRVIGGSNYMLRAASETVPGWEEQGVVVNPGCDVDLFVPREDPSNGEPVVSFVGKLIPQKGVHDFIAALPLIELGPFKVAIVGGGKFGDALKQFAKSFQTGEIAEAGAQIVNEAPQDMTTSFARFLEDGVSDAYAERAKEVSVEFVGHVDHLGLSQLLPNYDVMAVPSIVPEAFGMVGAEAAACGVLPIVPNHSGISEVGAAIESALTKPGLLTFDSKDSVHSIAKAIDRVLAIPSEERKQMGRVAADYAEKSWAWEVVTKKLLEAASA